MVDIVVDTREKKNNAILKYFADVGLEISYSPLDAGDYMFVTKDGETVLIERTRYTDFVGKIYSGRLWGQAKKLRSLGDIVVWILEDPYSLRFVRNLNMRVVYGAKVSLIKSGFWVIDSRNRTETAITIRTLFEQLHGERRAYITKKKFAHTLEEQAYEMLMGVRGIGLKKAKSLLERFGSVRNTVNADKTELSKVLGFKLAEVFSQVVNLDVSALEEEEGVDNKSGKQGEGKKPSKGLEVYGLRGDN